MLSIAFTLAGLQISKGIVLILEGVSTFLISATNQLIVILKALCESLIYKMFNEAIPAMNNNLPVVVFLVTVISLLLIRNEIICMVNEIWSVLKVFGKGIWEDADRRRDFFRLFSILIWVYGVVPYIFALFGAETPSYIKIFLPNDEANNGEAKP